MRIPFFMTTMLFLFFQVNTDAQIKWVFDGAHSNLQFSITNLMVSEIEGSIEITDAELVSAGNDFSNASISIKGDMATVDTDNSGRDEHLRGPDFFDVAKYPVLTFKSTSFTKVSDQNYTVNGILSFHGVSKSITMDVTATTAIRSYDNKEIVGFRAKGVIKKSDFN